MSTPTTQTEEELEQEARDLLAQIESSQAAFSAKAQELVSRLSVQAKTLDTDTETLKSDIAHVVDEAETELQQTTQEFVAEDEDVSDEEVNEA